MMAVARWAAAIVCVIGLYALPGARPWGGGAKSEGAPSEVVDTDVSWFAPFFSGGGYCSEAIAFVDALHRSDVRVRITQHGDSYSHDFVNGLPQKTYDRLSAMSRTRVSPQSAVAICHSEPGAWYPPRWPTARCPPANAQYTVGRTMFETDRLPEGWSQRLNSMDQIWVPTHFHRAVFEEGGVDPHRLRVLGEPVDVDFFDPVAVQAAHTRRVREAIPNTATDTFVLLSVFKWEQRKGWDVLLKAFFSEFRREDDVVLVVLTNAYHSTSDFDGEIRRFADRLGVSMDQLPRVHVHPRVDQADLPALYGASDVFVLPSRGEGWGRPHVEAMAMGLPIIATNWSGPTEYMHSHNAYPLRIDGMSTITDGAFKGHMWAEPSVEHLQELMRWVRDHPEERKTRGERARRDMVQFYSPAELGRQARVLLRDLTSPSPSRSRAASPGGPGSLQVDSHGAGSGEF